MTNTKKFPGSYIFYLVVSAVLWLVYLYLTFTAPINESTNTLHLSYSQLIWVKLSIALPFFVIWLIGTLAAIGVVRYVVTIKGSREELGFSRKYTGISILLFGLVFGAVLGAFRPFLADNQADLIILAVIVNYVNVFMPLIAFAYLFTGATHLSKLVEKPASSLVNACGWVLVACSAAFYAWVIFSNPTRQFGVGPNHSGALYLNDMMIVLTLMMPYVIMWGLGIFASIKVYNYRKQVEGTVYRSALSWFSLGTLFIVILSISFQGLGFLNNFFATASIQAILIAIYIILALIAVGYVLLWIGARKLRKIEIVL